MNQPLLIKNAEHILTMNDQHQELRGQDILISNGQILEIGTGLTPIGYHRTLNALGCVVTPDLVKTHHHLYQTLTLTLTRAVPGGQNALLFGWLQTLYPMWAKFGPEEIRILAMVGLAELALSGCTISSNQNWSCPLSLFKLQTWFGHCSATPDA
jgi:cytosine/adenosine deaminase-related metal-dependent hydrolase